jgi:phosphopantothenoylcysteine decarboxylase/phosphopantothenate--cysteine ligase
MQDFAGKKILLGVSGGIACYKSALLVRELTQLGAHVRVVMTSSAEHLMNPLLLQALSGHEVRTELFDTQAERAMGHIELARWADYLLIAPASASCLAKMAQGLANDLLSTLYLVCETPVLVCPAMNRSMWAHKATAANCALLRERGVIFIGPEEGSQACGEYGLGRMAEVPQIINALRLQETHQLLLGRRVLITAGPTREPIDPVRYLSNYSSGKMGFALAEAALMSGAQVTLISGPSPLTAPCGVHVIRVETAKEMLTAIEAQLAPDTIFIAAAAVADYHIHTPAPEKIKKNASSTLNLQLQPNPDLVSAVVASKKAAYVAGFAAETQDLAQHASEKLIKKNLDMIIANQVGPGLGFESDFNQVLVMTKKSRQELPLMHKIRLAGQLIAIIAAEAT